MIMHVKKISSECGRYFIWPIWYGLYHKGLYGMGIAHWLRSLKIHCGRKDKCHGYESHLLRRSGWFEAWIISLNDTDTIDQALAIFWFHNWDRNCLYWVFKRVFDWIKKSLWKTALGKFDNFSFFIHWSSLSTKGIVWSGITCICHSCRVCCWTRRFIGFLANFDLAFEHHVFGGWCCSSNSCSCEGKLSFCIFEIFSRNFCQSHNVTHIIKNTTDR